MRRQHCSTRKNGARTFASGIELDILEIARERLLAHELIDGLDRLAPPAGMR
jgi:hypothetical protein